MDINVLDPSDSINDNSLNFDISQQSTSLDSSLSHKEIQINTNCYKFPANSDHLLFHMNEGICLLLFSFNMKIKLIVLVNFTI